MKCMKWWSEVLCSLPPVRVLLLLVIVYLLIFAPHTVLAQSNQCGPRTVDNFNAAFQNAQVTTATTASGVVPVQQVGLFGRRGGRCRSGNCGSSSQDISVEVERRFSGQAAAPVTPQNQYSNTFEYRAHGCMAPMGGGCSCSGSACGSCQVEAQGAAIDDELIGMLRGLGESLNQINERVEKLETKKTEAKSTGYFPGYDYSMRYTYNGAGPAYAPSYALGYGTRSATYRAATQGALWGYPPKHFKTPVRSWLHGGAPAVQQDRLETELYNQALGY